MSLLLHVVNRWYETVDNRDVIVLAGMQTNTTDPSLGKVVVIVQDSMSYEIIGEPESYMTPSRNGYVEVIDAVGERLTLR
ncbi:MAG: hypothetical protein ACJ78Q_04765, partial [Chloroflexia bacterium]